MIYESKEVKLLESHKKMGRPTDSLKKHNVRARINDETMAILEAYCKEHNRNVAEAIRDGIHCLKDIPKK